VMYKFADGVYKTVDELAQVMHATLPPDDLGFDDF
jgi:hypothetical protein